ncbi:MAG: hypothetical protein ABIP74_03650 [Candidatus Saccharimonas sp.]
MDSEPIRNIDFEQRAFANDMIPSVHDFTDLNEARNFVNWCLEGSYNDRGIEAWWDRSRPQLEGATPAESWQTAPDKVVELAISLLN